MRIVRFLDENDSICYGRDYRDGMAALLKGRLFDGLEETGQRVRVRKLLAPVEPAAILCIGLNYHCHARELGAKIPKYPVLFMKNPAAVTHPGDPIVVPPSCMDPPQVDYEVELAVVLGRSAKDIPVDKALACVLGYTVANDVSAREWQKSGGAGQWVRGKSFDTFCPLGPELVTADEVPDPQSLTLKCLLNGEVMQEAETSDMIFSVAELIAYLSGGMTLLPGTVILTGTPPGVGFAREPAVYLKPGDLLELTCDRIGTLRNPVVRGE